MTPTEISGNLPDWKSLTGKTLSGGYELKEIIEAERDKATLRVRVLGDYSLKAAASFYVLDNTQSEEQISIWETARTVQNKRNLSIPLGTGTIDFGGVSAVYLVFQTPDETLADVLEGRSLQQDEAMELMRSLAAGLETLHSVGLIHGCLSPGNVLAIGDGIELSTGCLRRANAEPIVAREPAKYLAPESAGANVTTAADVWCFGASLFEALTGKDYQARLFDEAELLKHPFGSLVACCVNPDPDKRCKLSELDRIVRSPAPVPKPKSVPVTNAPEIPAEPAVPIVAVTPPSEAAALPASPRISLPSPVSATSSQVPVDVSRSSSEPEKPEKLANDLPPRGRPSAQPEELVGSIDSAETFRAYRGWIYGAAGFIVIFFALWLLRSSHRSQTSVSDVPQSSSSTGLKKSPVAPPTPAWPTKTLNPDAKPATQPKDNSKEPLATVEKPFSKGKAVWRVVLFTYNHQADAEKKVQSVNSQHPDLHAGVFSPSGSGKPYLVVVGGEMTREEAARERQRALRAGMPRDSYIQNYRH